MLLGIFLITTMSGCIGLIALELILEHIEITGKKPWENEKGE